MLNKDGKEGSRTSNFFSSFLGRSQTSATLAQQSSRQNGSVDELGRPSFDRSSNTMHTIRPQPPVEDATPPPLHAEIRSVVQLTHAHSHKVYFSGPLVRRLERQPDGHKPTKDDGWTDVWAQLNGTTLSIWDMKQIDEASKQGKEVPPVYVNTTDSVSILLIYVIAGSY
jgi:CCR4-NOT transcriptional complex subunit CAF120